MSLVEGNDNIPCSIYGTSREFSHRHWIQIEDGCLQGCYAVWSGTNVSEVLAASIISHARLTHRPDDGGSKYL
jgi:hypothetical protein